MIKGSVNDKSTNEPLAGCTILLHKSSTGTNTDLDGNFKLTGPLDTSVIEISLVGYNTLCDTIYPIKDSILTVNYFLEPFTFMHDDFGIWLTEKSAIRDVSNNLFYIYENFDDSLKSEINQIANEFGFSFKWFGDKGFVMSVEDYNNYVIKALEKRNGKNWYKDFRIKLNKIIFK